MSDEYCPLDRAKLNRASAQYKGTYFTCISCGIEYLARDDEGRREEARTFISRLEAQLKDKLTELKKDTSRLDLLLRTAAEHGFNLE